MRRAGITVPMPDAPVLLAGRYRLGESLGRGGMGQVLLARDETLERDVAIKELDRPFGSDDAASARRTLREARAAARINHPNVVQVYDVLQLDDRTWIVMEYVPCRSLREEIAEQGRLDPYRVARIGLDLLGALRVAHRFGVEHRDVKPANVLLADDGRVLLTDFGIAAVDDDGVISRSDILVGSPQFMAPERAQHGVSGPAADLWSLGATLYTAVEGRSPYERNSTMATLAALATEEPDPPIHAGPLRPLLDGLLQKDPAERIGLEDAEAVARAIVADLSDSDDPPSGPTGLAGLAAAFRIPRPRSPKEPSARPAASGKGRRPGSGASGRAAAGSAKIAGSAPVVAQRGSAANTDAGPDSIESPAPTGISNAASGDAGRTGAAGEDVAASGIGAGPVADVASDSSKAGAGEVAGKDGNADAAEPESGGGPGDAAGSAGDGATPDRDAEGLTSDPADEADASDGTRRDDADQPDERPAGAAGAAGVTGAAGVAGVVGSSGKTAAAEGSADAPESGRPGDAASAVGDGGQPHDDVPAADDSGSAAAGGASTKGGDAAGGASTKAGDAAGASPTKGGDATGASPTKAGDGAGAGGADGSEVKKTAGAGTAAADGGEVRKAADGSEVKKAADGLPPETPPSADPPVTGRGLDATRVDDPVTAPITGAARVGRGVVPRQRTVAVPDDGPVTGRGRRGSIVGAAALAVVLAVGAVWGLTRPDDGTPGAQPTVAASPEPGTGAAPGTGAEPGAGPEPGAGTGTPAPGSSADGLKAPPPASSSPSPSASPSGDGRPALPEGWVDYTDSSGFSVYVPKGWTRSKEGTMVYFRSKGKIFGVDQTDSPQPDPVADWRKQSRARLANGDFPGYDEVKIESVDFYRAAADWEFLRDRDGVRKHVNNRGAVISDNKAYGFYWETPESEWAAYRDDLDLIFKSFRPAK